MSVSRPSTSVRRRSWTEETGRPPCGTRTQLLDVGSGTQSWTDPVESMGVGDTSKTPVDGVINGRRSCDVVDLSSNSYVEVLVGVLNP